MVNCIVYGTELEASRSVASLVLLNLRACILASVHLTSNTIADCSGVRPPTLRLFGLEDTTKLTFVRSAPREERLLLFVLGPHGGSSEQQQQHEHHGQRDGDVAGEPEVHQRGTDQRRALH